MLTPKFSAFPAMRWHPTTGEWQIFKTADEVPEGWLNHHPEHKTEKEAPPPPQKKSSLDLTRPEIMEALSAGDIEFKQNTGTAALYVLLTEKVKAVLNERNIAFDDSAGTKALLGLLPAQE